MASTIGLYLGTEYVDLVELTGSFQHPRLIDFKRIPLPSKDSWRNQVRAEETGIPPTAEGKLTPAAAQGGDKTLLEALQSIQKKIESPSVQTYVAVAAEAVVIRYFQMPTIPAYERRTAIAFEAKKYLPFKLDELVTDYQVITRRSDPLVMRVMFFGIKKNSVATIMSLLKSLNTRPQSLEAAPMSLVRLLRQNEQLSAGRVAAILSVERDTATITIASSDVLYLSRNVTISTFSNPSEEPSTELLEALTNETRVSIDYYKRRFLGEPAVSKVLLYGKELDSKWTDELKAALNLPIEPGDPFRRVANAKEVPHSFAIAFGLALRGLEKRTVKEATLLPLEQRREQEGILKPFIAQMVAALMILGLCYGASIMDLQSEEKKINGLPRNYGGSAIDPSLSSMDIDGLEHFKADQQKQGRFLDALSGTAGNHLILLMQMTRLLPDEAWFQSALLNDVITFYEGGDTRHQSLRISGASYMNNRGRELENINNFLMALRSDPHFKTVFREFRLDSVQRNILEEEEITEFRITCSSNPEDNG